MSTSHLSMLLAPLLLARAEPLPHWSAPQANHSEPLGGYARLKGVTNVGAYFGSAAGGWYNHAAMMTYHEGVFTLSWKNAPVSEDTPGQRVLYAQSTDGRSWGKARVLFPNMSSLATPSAQFAGPFAVLRGRLYASASPAVIADGDAQGAQFCLWPDGLDPRNCAPAIGPGTQPRGLLMMRRVESGGKLGNIFWVSEGEASELYHDAAARHGIKQLREMDAETIADVEALTGRGVGTGFVPPCEGDGSGTLKCEGCPGGCEVYATGTKGLPLTNERCYYRVPNSTADVLLYRSSSTTLWASVREDGTPATQAAWGPVLNTTIPNDKSNLNCGRLPAGLLHRTFLVSNAAPKGGTIRGRDPLTIALSADGYDFDACFVVATCTDLRLPGPASSACGGRRASDTSYGLSYPQAVSVVAPAPEGVRGLYVVSTNNKEDVVVSRVPWEALPTRQGEALSLERRDQT